MEITNPGLLLLPGDTSIAATIILTEVLIFGAEKTVQWHIIEEYTMNGVLCTETITIKYMVYQ